MLMLCEMTDVWPVKCICTHTESRHVVHLCPVYYYAKIVQFITILKIGKFGQLKTPVAKTNMQNGKIFQGRVLKMAAITFSMFQVSTTTIILLQQTSFKYQNNQLGLQFSKLHKTQNAT